MNTDKPAGWRRYLLLALALLACVAGFTLALRGLDLAALGARMARMPAWLWLAAALGVLASHALRATRLHAEWHRRSGADWAACLRLSLLHNAAVLLMPLRSGELGYGLWLKQRWGVGWRESSRSLLWMRLQDVTVLATLTGLALWLPLARLAAALAALVALAVLALLLPADRPGRFNRTAWLCALANWSLRLAVVTLLLSALAGLPAEATLRGALGGEWAAVLPLQAPGGLGTYEAGVWAGLQGHVAGRVAPLDTLVAAALIAHLFWLAVGLVAAWPALLLDRTRPAPNPSSPLLEPTP
ncbi:lysylphosphatidylglycerol synthase domain-containing protein [Leptothrix sp. BB-4]